MKYNDIFSFVLPVLDQYNKPRMRLHYKVLYKFSVINIIVIAINYFKIERMVHIFFKYNK